MGYINAADICIAPLTGGSGTKIKTLAYMACEKVSVATPMAMEGIANYKGVLVYDMDNFSEGVLYAIRNIIDLDGMSKNARTFVESDYSQKKITKDVLDLLNNL